MEAVLICVILAVLGLCMGSFAGATVWRLRARQLSEDKAEGEKIDEEEYKQLANLTKARVTNDRSHCLHCGHRLAWYDLLPLASWISLGGKCRYCKRKIGSFEPLIEIATAVLFVISYLAWPAFLQSPVDIMQFALWLVAGVLLVILFAYDLKWFLLPNIVIFPLIAIGVMVAILHIAVSADTISTLVSIFVSVVILSGLYWLLWVISKGQWIGFGDVKLGLALALLLVDWQLAFVALFTANVIGSLMVIPGMLMGKITRKTRVPFGPLLISGSLVAMLFGDRIINWYFSSLL